MGDRLGIPGAVGSLPSLSFSPRPHVPTLGLPHPNPSWGWVARAPTPAADLGCLRAAREPLCIWLPGNQRTVPRVSVWGSLGVPQAIPGGLQHHQPQPQPQPRPRRRSRVLARAPARAHTDSSAQKVPASCWVIYFWWLYACEWDCRIIWYF